MLDDNLNLTRKETKKHIQNVEKYIDCIIEDLTERAVNHDSSKLEKYELNGFSEYTPKLKHSEYGSEEYKSFLKDLQPILEHHYENNDHHPEHFENGIMDMNLMQITEMLCDWKAATLRHKNGNIYSSIEYNQDRFDYSNEFKQILINTCRSLGW